MGAISIDPFNSIISASIKFSDRKLFVSLGNFEAIVDPANSLTFFSLAAKDNLHFPISRSRTSKNFLFVSKRTSFPTIPISTAP